VHLIYRTQNYEGHSKDYDFSRASMHEHWRAGYHDAVRTLRHPEVAVNRRKLRLCMRCLTRQLPRELPNRDR
jgi:hypothetical protein